MIDLEEEVEEDLVMDHLLVGEASGIVHRMVVAGHALHREVLEAVVDDMGMIVRLVVSVETVVAVVEEISIISAWIEDRHQEIEAQEVMMATECQAEEVHNLIALETEEVGHHQGITADTIDHAVVIDSAVETVSVVTDAVLEVVDLGDFRQKILLTFHL